MKKYISISIAILNLMTLSACRNMDTQLQSTQYDRISESSQTDENRIADEDSNLQLLYYQYIDGIDKTGIPLKSWKDPSEIRPDYFVTFFSVKTGLNRVSTDYGIKIPSTVYEPYIQLYFDVTSEKLKKTRHYSPADDTYSISIVDGRPAPKVIDAAESGGILILTLEYYSATEDGLTPSGQCQIKIDRIDENRFTYVECDTEDFQYQSNTLSSDDVKSFEEYAASFLETAALGDITSYTWDNAAQIPPDCFVSYYLAYTGNQKADNHPIDAAELEEVVQQHFNVDKEDIRKSNLYSQETQTYATKELKTKLAKVVSASEYKNSVTLYFEYYNLADSETIIRDGILYIERTEDGGYKYKSCETTDLM